MSASRGSGILRLSHADVRVPDLELALAYYSEVVGLIITAYDGQRAYLKAWDEQQHHSLVLTRADTYGLNSLAFKVAEADELDRLASRVDAVGISVERYQPGELGIGSGPTVRFVGPSGHTIDLEHGMLQVGNGLSLINPPPAPDNLVGMHPPRIDHIFLLCEDVDGSTRFFQDTLEFRLTEQIVADDGHQLATFLERTHTPHDIAFLTGPDGGFHHLAYWVDEWNESPHCRRHLRVPRGDHRCRPHSPRRHAGLWPVLLRSRRQPQRGVHGRVSVRPRRCADHVDRSGDGAGDLHVQRSSRPELHDGALMTGHS